MKDSSGRTSLLRNVRAVLPDRVLQGTSLLVKDGRIMRISDSHPLETAELILDLEGLTLFPGFIDIHIHGASGVDTMTANADDLGRVSAFLAANGVTGWLPTLVPDRVEAYERAVSAIDDLLINQFEDPSGDAQAKRIVSQSSQGARALGLHYEGPFVNLAQCGALRAHYFRTFSADSQIDQLPIPRLPGACRMMTVAPEIDGGVNLVRELQRRGWIVSIGHTRADPATLDQARAEGARHMTHFMNAMSPLHHRVPGPVAWGLANDDVTCDLIADGVHIDEFVLQLLLKLKKPERLTLISDAIAAAGMGDGDYQIWEETITVEDGRTSNEQGSIAGSVITMLDGVRMMLSLGAAETDVARMAATNPAALLGLSADCGSIELGKRADLVALDENGNPAMTMIGGSVAFDRGK